MVSIASALAKKAEVLTAHALHGNEASAMLELKVEGQLKQELCFTALLIHNHESNDWGDLYSEVADIRVADL